MIHQMHWKLTKIRGGQCHLPKSRGIAIESEYLGNSGINFCRWNFMEIVRYDIVYSLRCNFQDYGRYSTRVEIPECIALEIIE